MKKKTYKIILFILALILVNVMASKVFYRLDITKDKRYSLSDNSITLLKELSQPTQVKVYLEGEFPAEFKRLQTETKQLLEEFKALNQNIVYEFIDPIDKSQTLIEQGLEPSRLSVQENGKVSEAIIFPWASIHYNDKIENISLLSSQSTGEQEEQLQRSIEGLEFGFIDALHKITSSKQKKIAVLRGNGQLEDKYLVSLLGKLSKYYLLAPFTLDSVSSSPNKTLAQLVEYDLAIIAKPT